MESKIILGCTLDEVPLHGIDCFNLFAVLFPEHTDHPKEIR